MAKGIAIKFKSYEETLPYLLRLIKIHEELIKHDRIILKPNLVYGNEEYSTKIEFIEPILKFIVDNKSPNTEIFIAEGCDGHETTDILYEKGYFALAEKFGISLIDLNNADVEEITNNNFLGFESIKYPKILMHGFVISLPLLKVHEETGITGSLDNMIGAFPSRYYKGFFSKAKNKLNKYDKKYQIHDIIQCRMPSCGIIDASEKGYILAGQPFEIDKQATKIFGLDWRNIAHLDLIAKTLSLDNPEIKQ